MTLPKPLPTVRILGVPILDLTLDQALALLDGVLRRPFERAHSVFFVNAHTLNCAAADPSYHDVLARGNYVFGDGTGVRWAARALHGVRLRGNVNGTDLLPRMLSDLGGKGYRYFLLGNTEDRIAAAAAHAARTFTGWELVGRHHGFLSQEADAAVIREINQSGAHLLLVGMGNPAQERWISEHLSELRVPLCVGVGGLFDYWSGGIKRAPAWVRQLGHEWLALLMQQPHKARRYLLGNPLFLIRVVRNRLTGADEGGG